MFSSRVPANLETNALSRAVHAAKVSGRRLVDLTMTNPTKAGFVYPDALRAAVLPAPAACLRSGAVRFPGRARSGLLRLRASRHRDFARLDRSHRRARATLTRCSSSCCASRRATRSSCRRRAIRCSSTSPGSTACRRCPIRWSITAAGCSTLTSVDVGVDRADPRRARRQPQQPHGVVPVASTRSRACHRRAPRATPR